jgi:hypothetical protein
MSYQVTKKGPLNRPRPFFQEFPPLHNCHIAAMLSVRDKTKQVNLGPGLQLHHFLLTAIRVVKAASNVPNCN